MQAMCDVLLDDLKSGNTERHWRVANVVHCLNNGNLSENDFLRNNLVEVLDKARPLVEKQK